MNWRPSLDLDLDAFLNLVDLALLRGDLELDLDFLLRPLLRDLDLDRLVWMSTVLPKPTFGLPTAFLL